MKESGSGGGAVVPDTPTGHAASVSRSTIAPAVELRNVSKSFGGITAIRRVNLSIRPGEVHALVGENGAGKSTLGKIIAGALPPSEGAVLVGGAAVQFRSPRQAIALGISLLDQELGMIPSRSVVDNVFLGAERARWGLASPRAQRREFADLVERTGFDLPANVPVGGLRVSDQQKVEIMRAISRRARIIVMDEPTAPLTQQESELLYEVIRRLTKDGVTIVFVSHFLSEVLEIADTITVMRDGNVVRTGPASAESQASLVAGMLGKSVDILFPQRTLAPVNAKVALKTEALTRFGHFHDIDLEIHAGEILGLAGLVGSGRTEVARALAGLDRIDSGVLRLDGGVVRLRSPRDAIAHGVAMLTESRKDDGLIMKSSVGDNIVLPSLPVISWRGVLRRKRQKSVVDRMIRDLNIMGPGAAAAVEKLSGGNQQKVVFAKWLVTRPTVLIVDEPTRGVDVGAKRAIHDLIVSTAAQGAAVLVISSELEEVLGLAHRVLVMRLGRAVANLPIDEASKERVLSAAFGTEETT